MKHCFKFEDLTIYGESGEDPHTINVEVELKCTDKGCAQSWEDPGWPPVWEVRCIWLQHPNMTTVMMTETQFVLVAGVYCVKNIMIMNTAKVDKITMFFL